MKLMDQVQQACLTKHYSPRTEESYARRIERSLRFHPGKWGHNTGKTGTQYEARDLWML